MKGEFETTVHCPELDDSVTVLVQILSAYAGAPATRWEPAEDPEIELAVYREESDQDAWDSLSENDKSRIWDEAFDYLKHSF